MNKKNRQNEDIFTMLNESIYYMIALGYRYNDIMEFPVSTYFKVLTKIPSVLKMRSIQK